MIRDSTKGLLKCPFHCGRPRPPPPAVTQLDAHLRSYLGTQSFSGHRHAAPGECHKEIIPDRNEGRGNHVTVNTAASDRLHTRSPTRWPGPMHQFSWPGANISTVLMSQYFPW